MSIQKEFDVILKRFKNVDIVGKVNIKKRCAPTSKVKTKGVETGCATKFARLTKRIPSYFEHVDALQSQQDSSSTRKSSKGVNQETRKK